MVLSTLAVVGRLGARKLTRRALDASDYTIITGLLAAWLTSAAIMAGKSRSPLPLMSLDIVTADSGFFVGTVFGIGRHIEVVESNASNVAFVRYPSPCVP